MENTILALESLLNEREKDLRKLDENLILESPAPGKWSKKQIMGHLVDSALNNARRFVAGQYEHMPQITSGSMGRHQPLPGISFRATGHPFYSYQPAHHSHLTIYHPGREGSIGKNTAGTYHRMAGGRLS